MSNVLATTEQNRIDIHSGARGSLSLLKFTKPIDSKPCTILCACFKELNFQQSQFISLSNLIKSQLNYEPLSNECHGKQRS